MNKKLSTLFTKIVSSFLQNVLDMKIISKYKQLHVWILKFLGWSFEYKRLTLQAYIQYLLLIFFCWNISLYYYFARFNNSYFEHLFRWIYMGHCLYLYFHKYRLRSQIMSIAKSLNQAIFNFFQKKWKLILNIYITYFGIHYTSLYKKT